MKKWLIGLLFLFLAIELVTFLPERLADEKPKQEVAKTALPPTDKGSISQTMEGIHTVESGPKGREWELRAKSGLGYKEKGRWDLTEVNMTFFGSNNTEYYAVSDKGNIRNEGKQAVLTGNVKLTAKDGYVLTTTLMNYDKDTHSFFTDEHVDIVGPPEGDGKVEMSGDGFHSDTNTNVMTLKKNTKATKPVPPDRIMYIESVWAKVNGKLHEAHFEENVKVDIGDVRMTGDTADFVYDEKQKKLESLLMQGNVKLTSLKHWAVAQKAKVLFEKDEFILTGSPRIIQQDNVLKGEVIKFLKGGKEVQVSKAKARMEHEEKE